MAKLLRDYKKQILLGYVDKKPIYLTAPKWECNWYWGFGYLGNVDSHYHIDGLTTQETFNNEKKCFETWRGHLFDGFKRHFDKGTFIVNNDNDLWKLCELFQSYYELSRIAEVFGRGGCNYTTNPCSEYIIDKTKAKEINEVILPQIFDEIYKILKIYDK